MRARIARVLRKVGERLDPASNHAPSLHEFLAGLGIGEGPPYRGSIVYSYDRKPKPFVPRESWRSEQIGLGVERCPRD